MARLPARGRPRAGNHPALLRGRRRVSRLSREWHSPRETKHRATACARLRSVGSVTNVDDEVIDSVDVSEEFRITVEYWNPNQGFPARRCRSSSRQRSRACSVRLERFQQRAVVEPAQAARDCFRDLHDPTSSAERRPVPLSSRYAPTTRTTFMRSSGTRSRLGLRIPSTSTESGKYTEQWPARFDPD